MCPATRPCSYLRDERLLLGECLTGGFSCGIQLLASKLNPVRPPPDQSLDPKVVTLWRIQAVFRAGFYGLFLASLLASLVMLAKLPPAATTLLSAAFVLLTALGVIFLPRLRYKYWRYEVGTTELDLQSGVFVIRRTLVPLIRVQNVDSVQGPLAKRLGLTAVTVSTAASTHVIPALSDERAAELRDNISRLAQEARDAD